MKYAPTDREALPLRGTSIPQQIFAADSHMDQLAAKLGIDPLEFRLRNAVDIGSVTHTGEVLDEAVGAKSTLMAIKTAYTEALGRKASDPPPYPWKRGVGIACAWKGFGGDREGQRTKTGIELLDDGRVRVLSGAVEKGQGDTTVLTQIAAEELGLSMESMDILLGDTKLAPYPWSTNGERTTFHVGGAVVRAARVLKLAIAKAASYILECPQDTIVIKDASVYSTTAPDEKLSLREIAAHFKKTNTPTKYEGTMFFEKTQTAHGNVYGYASQLSEVDVNMETGQVRVRRVYFGVDAGTIINPLAFEGQVDGGVVHAIGFALKEKFVPGITTTLKGLNVPNIKDVPEMIVALPAPEPVSGGPFGAKGVGTTIVCPGPAATLNAIADATGIRIYEMPATPSKVREASGIAK